MIISRPASWTTDRIVIWALLAGGILAWRLYSAEAFHPPKFGVFRDFHQEWLAVQNHRAGKSIYDPLEPTVREVGERSNLAVANVELPYCAHPPLAVLVSLPFGWLDYVTAHMTWMIIMTILFAWTLHRLTSLLPIEWSWPMYLPMVFGLCFFPPLFDASYQGNVMFLMLFALVEMWTAERNGRWRLAGFWLAFAIGLKLIPLLFLGLYIVRREWWIATATLVFILIQQAIAAALFGFSAFQEYVNVVSPSLGNYTRYAWNYSYIGLCARLFDPDPTFVATVPAALFPNREFYLISRLIGAVIVASVLIFVTLRSRTAEQRIRTNCAAMVGMLLLSPVAWTQYMLLTIPALMYLWGRLERKRWLILVIGLPFMLPQLMPILPVVGFDTYAKIGELERKKLPYNLADYIGLNMLHFYVFAIRTYALVGLFAILLLMRRKEDSTVDS